MDDRAGQETPINLAEFRHLCGVTQAELAAAMGTTQPAVLKLERSPDPQLSSIRRYVQALGSLLEVTGRIEINGILGNQRHLLEIEGTAPVPKEDAVQLAEMRSIERPAWRLRAWDDPHLEQRFLDEDVIAISGDEIGDLTDWPDDATLRQMLTRRFRDRGQQAIGTFARYWRDFRVAMQPGDIVVVPIVGRRVAIGEITGEYAYNRSEEEPRLRHTRAVQWLAVGLDRDALDEDLRKVANAPGTICRFGSTHASRRLRTVAGAAER